MNQTPPELLAPYKAALVAAARDLLRAAGTDGIAIEIPASVPPCVVVLGAEDNVGQLLRTPAREPMLGGRRAGDPPPEALSWEEPTPGAPRKWTILMTGKGHGLTGALGSKFEHAPDNFERIDVVELVPMVDQLATAIEQNAQHLETVQQLRDQVAELQQRIGAPEGWKLVPEAITEGMHGAAVRAIHRAAGNHDFPPAVWSAMLAAAPSAPNAPPCPHCDDTGDVHRPDGEWMGRCSCPAGAQEGGAA